MYQKALSEPSAACFTAVAIGSTVVGILFDKKGTEIRDAAKARLKSIDLESDRLRGLLDPLLVFIAEKEAFLGEVQSYEVGCRNSKTEELEGPREKVARAQKAFAAAADAIDKGISEALKPYEEKFQEGWGKFNEAESVLSGAIRAEKLVIPDARTDRPQNAQRAGGTRTSTPTSTPTCTATCTHTPTGTSTPDYAPDYSHEWIPTVSGEMQARISRHKGLAQQVAERLRSLDEERRVLYLVSYNIDPKRAYKMTLEQLSSFGFEDLE